MRRFTLGLAMGLVLGPLGGGFEPSRQHRPVRRAHRAQDWRLARALLQGVLQPRNPGDEGGLLAVEEIGWATRRGGQVPRGEP